MLMPMTMAPTSSPLDSPLPTFSVPSVSSCSSTTTRPALTSHKRKRPRRSRDDSRIGSSASNRPPMKTKSQRSQEREGTVGCNIGVVVGHDPPPEKRRRIGIVGIGRIGCQWSVLDEWDWVGTGTGTGTGTGGGGSRVVPQIMFPKQKHRKNKRKTRSVSSGVCSSLEMFDQVVREREFRVAERIGRVRASAIIDSDSDSDAGFASAASSSPLKDEIPPSLDLEGMLLDDLTLMQEGGLGTPLVIPPPKNQLCAFVRTPIPPSFLLRCPDQREFAGGRLCV